MTKENNDNDAVLEGEILSSHFDNAEDKADANSEKVKSKFWKTLSKANKQLPEVQNVVAAYYCAFDPQTPNKTRAILLAALAYFVMPLDSIPDFLLGFGFTDDIAVLSIAYANVRANITQAHRDAAKDKLNQN